MGDVGKIPPHTITQAARVQVTGTKDLVVWAGFLYGKPLLQMNGCEKVVLQMVLPSLDSAPLQSQIAKKNVGCWAQHPIDMLAERC